MIRLYVGIAGSLIPLLISVSAEAKNLCGYEVDESKIFETQATIEGAQKAAQDDQKQTLVCKTATHVYLLINDPQHGMYALKKQK